MSDRDELIECLRVCGACHGCGIGADGDTCTNCGDERQLNRLAASLLERDGDEIERLGRELAEAREERYPPIPPNGSAARSLGAYLADVLCEDQWARAEEMLLGIHAAYVALCAENEALRTDVERYRWLRNESLHRLIRGPICIDADTWGEPVMACGKHITLDGATLDAAIDAAMEGGK